ncbi:O-antigen ligase family protein [Telluribacter sp.]|uniref:O-antigen ligase family protein n=1 Tax=Telluribacter sp. TaxID=1978767 RepID=UPI002E0F1557|nr:O-antigen ligase family protein [Telluribacter sp.]
MAKLLLQNGFRTWSADDTAQSVGKQAVGGRPGSTLIFALYQPHQTRKKACFIIYQFIQTAPMALGLRHLLHVLLLLVLIAALAAAITKGQLLAIVALLGLPLAIAYLVWIFKVPVVGLYSVLVVSFVAIGLTRYISAPLGLAVDALLVLTLGAEFFYRFDTRQWPMLRRNPVLIAIGIWVVYCLIEVVNPEARSMTAWFYAIRGVALYLVLTVLLVMEQMNHEKHLNRFITIWFGWSCIAALYGTKQFIWGVDAAEQAWLNAGNASTHLLQGRLRVFSFYSDAGQFGAAMAHAGLASLVMSLGAFPLKKRAFYIVTCLLCFYAMLISGTRGALFVPLSGFAVYLLMARNFRLLVVGGLAAFLLFGMLKFTYIGQSNYQVQRMRSALDPNEPSLMVRLENQKKLATYLASRPLGGGIGSAGYWGLKFSPNTVLAQTPTDSWYVKIWAETGIIGLILHLGMILFFLFYFFKKLWAMPSTLQRQQLLGLYAGLTGIAVASYGNQVLGQIPTGTILYMSIGFLYLFTRNRHDQSLQEQKIPLNKHTLY